MVLSNSMTAVVSGVLGVCVFSGMQLYRHVLGSSGPFTILGGFLGSLLFIFMLTAVGNAGLIVFGKNYQTGLFPEVIFCLFISLIASGLVHGVCFTTCFLFSTIALYYVNQISQKSYANPQSNSQQTKMNTHKKK